MIEQGWFPAETDQLRCVQEVVNNGMVLIVFLDPSGFTRSSWSEQKG